MTDDSRNDTTEYFALLSGFTDLCQELIDNGQPYMVVVLAHELFRFLYPMEPYADVTHTKPVEFVTKHIRALIELGAGVRETVAPYEGAALPLSRGVSGSSLPRATSDLYSLFWKEFDQETLVNESAALLKNRLPAGVIEECIAGRSVLDLGCGSGRYCIAMASVGAGRVVGVDYQARSFHGASEWCKQQGLPVSFVASSVHELALGDNQFDFVFCNGVLHHTDSIERGLKQLVRVLRPSGRAFVYLYAAGGIFWQTRKALRAVMSQIPIEYTQGVLRMIGMPSSRFIFCDTWYVPVETHTTTERLEKILGDVGAVFSKLVGNSPYDLDRALADGISGAREMWGDGEHRYLLSKQEVA